MLDLRKAIRSMESEFLYWFSFMCFSKNSFSLWCRDHQTSWVVSYCFCFCVPVTRFPECFTDH